MQVSTYNCDVCSADLGTSRYGYKVEEKNSKDDFFRLNLDTHMFSNDGEARNKEVKDLEIDLELCRDCFVRIGNKIREWLIKR